MKPRLIKRMGRWYCSSSWYFYESVGRVYRVNPRQMSGFDTMEQAYEDWHDIQYPKSIFYRLKLWIGKLYDN